MKSTYQFLFIAILLVFIGCKKDVDSPAYGEKEIITVEGFEDNYTVMTDIDVLKINVQAHSNLEGSEFEYKWGVYETAVMQAAKMDTIGTSANLVYPVHLNAKTWMLVLYAKNKKTGLSIVKESTLNVVTQYTRGWYVAKTMGDSSDLDLFVTPEKINELDDNPNIFSSLNGFKVYGKAKQLSFLSNYKTDLVNAGVFANTRCLFLVTEKDVSNIYINNLRQFRNSESLSIGPKPAGDMNALFFSYAYYYIKGGKMYSIFNLSANTGKFGERKLINENDDPYELSDYFLASPTTGDPILFDKISSSFVSMSMGYGPYMTKLSDAAGTDITVNNNNQMLLFMGFRAGTSAKEGFAIFQDKSNPALKRIGKLTTSGNTILIKLKTLAPTSKVYNDSNFGLLKNEENLLYFTNANKIYSYNLDNQTEQLQFDTPADEQITFIKHQKYTESANTAYSYNYVMVGSKRGSGYRIRFFEKVNGNIKTTPAFIIEGEGTAQDVIYISPSVVETTYPNSY